MLVFFVDSSEQLVLAIELSVQLWSMNTQTEPSSSIYVCDKLGLAWAGHSQI